MTYESISLLSDCEAKSHWSFGILLACDAYDVLSGLQRNLTHFNWALRRYTVSFNFIVTTVLVGELQACEIIVLEDGDLRDWTVFQLTDCCHILAVSKLI